MLVTGLQVRVAIVFVLVGGGVVDEPGDGGGGGGAVDEPGVVDGGGGGVDEPELDAETTFNVTGTEVLPTLSTVMVTVAV